MAATLENRNMKKAIKTLLLIIFFICCLAGALIMLTPAECLPGNNELQSKYPLPY
jgi:hypothetical protein